MTTAFRAARIVSSLKPPGPSAGPVPHVRRDAYLQFTEERSLEQIDMVFTVTAELDDQSATAEYWVRVGDDGDCPLTLRAHFGADEALNLTPNCLFVAPGNLAAKAQAFIALGLAMGEMATLLAEKRPILEQRVRRLDRLADRIVTGAPAEEDGADDIADAGAAR